MKSKTKPVLQSATLVETAKRDCLYCWRVESCGPSPLEIVIKIL